MTEPLSTVLTTSRTMNGGAAISIVSEIMMGLYSKGNEGLAGYAEVES